MAVFKCKMCGGTLDITEGMTVCECEYCGSTQTVPQLDDEKKINLFTRANRLRLACEFDKAFGVYESIVSEFSEEAEAYWGLILCKYGIEYVDDPATGKKIPTCHRSSFDSVMDDPNFEMVMEYSDAVSRRVYRDEAKQIEELRKGIIEVSANEEPYDIFICYKETDEDGNRTIDSVIAQDIYKELSNEGYRVFFARISLEDKLGTAYEPYIFAALNSAKVMLAVGTDYDYYNAVWVKNEWSRFLALIAKGEKKTLIPCYKDIDAYDIPREFKHLQAQDMGKVGAMQDLLRGIGKILGTKKQNVQSGNAVVDSNASAMIQRGNMALEDNDFQNAVSFFERALDSNPKAAHAYLGKFLAFHRLTSLRDLQNKVCALENNKEFKRAEQFADPELAKELKEVRDSNELKIQRLRFLDVICKGLKQAEIKEKRAAEIEEKYIKACSLQDSAEENQLVTASKMFKVLKGYKDSAERLTECEQTYKERKAEREAREEKERAERAAREEQERKEKEALEKAKRERSALARNRISKYQGLISAGSNHTVGLKSDGTVLVTKLTNGKEYDFGQFKVKNWHNIVQVSASPYITLGLKDDGTVVATKISGDPKIDYFQYYVSDWSCVKYVSAGLYYSVGLRTDGTVLAVGAVNGRCDVKTWHNIVSIAAGSNHTVGVKADGTVIAVGNNDYGQCNVSGWKDIVAIAVGDDHTVGLKSDGTVVAAGLNTDGQCDVSMWQDIVAISAFANNTVGLKANGTVAAAGNNRHGQCNVNHWRDIVAISVGGVATIGLRSDGTVVAVGNNYTGRCNVGDWKLFKSEKENNDDYTTACKWQESGEIDTLYKAADAFRNLKDYKDSAERAKACMITALNIEKSELNKELSKITGVFAGSRRKKIETRLAEIESELNRL